MATSESTTKQCTKCGNEYPATTEYFHKHRNGLHPYCKVCKNVAASKYSRIRNQRPEIKERNRLNMVAWRKEHADEHNAYSREYRSKNREKLNTQRREREAAKPPHERIAYRYKQRHPEKSLASQYKWRKNNPEKWRAVLTNGQRTRKARKRNAEGRFTVSDVAAQLKAQKGRCWWCQEPLNDKFHPDHVIPLSRGGTNHPNNIVVSCVHCNLSKHDKMPWEWNGRLL